MPGSNIKKQKPRKQTAIKINFYHFPAEAQKNLRHAAGAALAAQARCKRVPAGEINFILISDREIKKLNRKYRRVNRITDVISFLNSSRPFQGDIYISRQRSRKQAREQGHGWKDEMAYLVIHGILHLFGYTDYAPRERKRMFAVQDKVFECL